MTDPSNILPDLVEQCGQLYTLPGVAMRVLELTSNPTVDAAALRACIENDPALTAKLLKVVNSSLFGLSRQVSDLNQALALLGVKPLKLLVLGFSLPDALFTELAGDVLGVYWRHTLTKSITSRELSQNWWKLAGDEAFLAGLLQDLGLLALIQQLGEPMVAFLNRVEAEGVNLLEAERDVFGFDHTTLSARLLSSWNLPTTLVSGVQAPPNLDAARQMATTNLQRVLFMSELLTQLLVRRPAGVARQLRDAMRAMRVGDPEKLGLLISDLEPKVDQLAEVLSLSLNDGTDYTQILALAQRQMAEISVEAAAELNERALESRERLQKQDEVRTLNQVVRELSQRMRQSRGQGRGHERDQETRETQASHPAEQQDSRAAEPAQVISSEAPKAQETGESNQRRDNESGPQRPRRERLEGKPADRPLAVDDPGFLGALAVAAARCRQVRTSLSLLLAELDGVSAIAFAMGADEAEQCLAYFQRQCTLLGPPGVNCVQTREGHFAVILPDCERKQAVELGQGLIAAMRNHPDGNTSPWPVSVAIGVANVDVPPRNFQQREMITAADRCLYAARAAGGGIVKSIAMY